MNLRDLEYIAAIGKHKSFSKAANVCNVSQPTLSNQVKKIEQELGADLFLRKKKEIIPTQLGHRVATSALSILAEVQLIRDMAAEYRDPLSLPLRIGMTQCLAPYLMDYLIEQVHTLQPELSITFVDDDPAQLTNSVINRDIDIALIPRKHHDDKVDYTSLFTEPAFLATGSDHPFTQRDAISLSEIPSEQIIRIHSDLSPHRQEDAEKMQIDSQMNGHVNVTTRNLDTACRHVRTSNKVAIVPALAAHQYKNDDWPVAFIPIQEDDAHREIGVISRLSCPRKPLLSALCKQIYAVLPSGVIANRLEQAA